MTNYAEVITGMTTGNNDKFLRLWTEVDYLKLSLNNDEMKKVNIKKTYWIPYNKGGERCNWYGDNEYVVNWARKDEFNRPKTTLSRLYLKEGVTWPFITTGTFSARYFPNGFLWDVAGSPCFFQNHNDLLYGLGVMCSKISDMVLKNVNPTVNIQAVDIGKLPILFNISGRKNIEFNVENAIQIAKDAWDSYEVSWDFLKHPLLSEKTSIVNAFEQWNNICEERRKTIKKIEEQNNEIFIN